LSALAALTVSGAIALLLQTSPSIKPDWPDYSALDSMIPMVELALDSVIQFFIFGGFFLLAFTWTYKVTRQGQSRKWLVILSNIIFGFVFIGQFSFNSVLSFCLGAVVVGSLLWMLYYGLFRHQLNLVWIFTAALIVMKQLAKLLTYSQPLFLTGIGISIMIIVVLGGLVYKFFLPAISDKL
jgi:hypothetical protein